MDESCADMTYFVADGLKLGQKLLDSKRAECAAALDGADESASLRVQNVSL